MISASDLVAASAPLLPLYEYSAFGIDVAGINRRAPGLHVERVCRAERRDRLVAVPESEGIPRWHCYEETAGGSPFRLVPRIRKF